MSKTFNLSASQGPEAVLPLPRRDDPRTTVARRYGICQTTLCRWCEEFIYAGEAALANRNNGSDGQKSPGSGLGTAHGAARRGSR